VVVAAALVLAAWRWLNRARHIDMVEVLQRNNRGVGLMDQFQYAEAAKVFEDVTRSAPDWLPAQINLGIALLNAQDSASLNRASALFKRVVEVDPQNNY